MCISSSRNGPTLIFTRQTTGIFLLNLASYFISILSDWEMFKKQGKNVIMAFHSFYTHILKKTQWSAFAFDKRSKSERKQVEVLSAGCCWQCSKKVKHILAKLVQNWWLNLHLKWTTLSCHFDNILLKVKYRSGSLMLWNRLIRKVISQIVENLERNSEVTND